MPADHGTPTGGDERRAEIEAVKRCTNCGETKPLSEYFARRDSADGKNTQCRSCHATRTGTWRRANPEARRRHDAAWMLRNQEKYAAKRAIGQAVRRGRIVRPSTCSECGVECVVHGHHDDYSKPLEVRWLCPICHAAQHVGSRKDPIARYTP